MAKVFTFIKNDGPTVSYLAEDRDTSSVTAAMVPGEPVKVGGTGTNFATPFATGDAEVGTDEFIGLVRKTSTETATADGKVEVKTIIPGLSTIRGFATTATNIDTASELDGVVGDWVSGDVTAVTGTNGDFTIDENEGTDPNVHCFKILTGDTAKGTLDCLVHALASQAAPLTGQTMD